MTAGNGASAAPAAAPAGAAGNNLSLLGIPIGFTDVDARDGQVAPTAARRTGSRALGAVGPLHPLRHTGSLIPYGGPLFSAYTGDAVTVARTWLKGNASLFRMTPAEVDALPVLDDQGPAGGAGHAVLFRQQYGGLPAAQDGLVDVR